jgi:hypothetical protein
MMTLDMDFDAQAIERAAAAAGHDAVLALCEDYHRKIVQLFGAWIVVKRVDIEAAGEEYATAAAVGFAEAIRALPGYQIDRVDFDRLPIFDFDFLRDQRLPAGTHRLRFGDTWLVWSRPGTNATARGGSVFIAIPMEMIYRVNISTGPRWE